MVRFLSTFRSGKVDKNVDFTGESTFLSTIYLIFVDKKRTAQSRVVMLREKLTDGKRPNMVDSPKDIIY